MNPNIIKRLMPLMACIVILLFFPKPAVSGWVDENRQRLNPGSESAVSGDVWTEVTEGEAAIIDGDTAIAKEKALNQCKQFAIEKVLGVYVEATSIGRDYEQVKEEIYTSSRGFAYPEEILSESSEGGIYTVKARIAVSLEPFLDELCKYGLTRKWRIMVVVPETHLGRPRIPDPAAETAIVGKFLDFGYRLMDQDLATKVRYDDDIVAAASGDSTAIKRLFEQCKADVLITGEAFSQSIGRVGNFSSCRARVEVKAIRRDSGEIISAVAKQESGLDATDEIAGKVALEKAGHSAAAELIHDISKLPAALDLPFEVIIENCDSITVLSDIESRIWEIPGVSSVDRDEYDEGTAYLLVTVDNAWFENFPVEIEAIESPILKVSRATKNSMTVEVVPGV